MTLQLMFGPKKLILAELQDGLLQVLVLVQKGILVQDIMELLH